MFQVTWRRRADMALLRAVRGCHGGWEEMVLAKAVASSVVSGVDTGYAGSSGLMPQQFVSNNQPCGFICYGFGEFDGQGSGHDFSGNFFTQ
eukprot:761900-Hanusia_phi.AAC.6